MQLPSPENTFYYLYFLPEIRRFRDSGVYCPKRIKLIYLNHNKTVAQISCFYPGVFTKTIHKCQKFPKLSIYMKMYNGNFNFMFFAWNLIILGFLNGVLGYIQKKRMSTSISYEALKIHGTK